MERIDERRTTFDCGVRANFLQESRASASDENTEMGMLDYFGTIQDILKIGFRRFDIFIFDVKWFKVITSGAHASVQRDKSGLIQVDKTKLWTDARDTYVRPEHCEQVVFKSDPKDPRWLYVIQVAPRSKPICKGLEEQVDEVGEQEPADVAQQQEEVVEEDQAVQEVEEAVQEVEEADEEEQAVQEVEEVDEEDIGHAETTFNDDDAEMHLEIDVFGITDLEEDDRIDDL